MGLHLTLAGSATATEHMRGSMSISRSINALSTLTVRVRGAKGTPSGGMEVGAYLGTDKPFGGIVTQVTRARIGNSTVYDTAYDLLCQGWEHRLAYRIVQARIYTSLNAGAVVLDLLDTECVGEGFNIGVVEDGLSAEDLGVLQFIGRSVYEIIDDLAVRCNFNWWITSDKDFHFRSKDTGTAADLVFSDANENVTRLSISETGEDYVNVVKIMIGWDQVGATPVDFIGDGSAQTFTIADVGGEFQAIDHVSQITLNGVVQTIGILGVDLDAQWNWAVGSNVITQNTADPAITSADTLSVSYYVIGRNVIVEEDAAEIAARVTVEGGSGRYELFVDDSANSDQVGAQNKALAILDKRCPGRNGAPAGTWPKVYSIETYSYVADSIDLIPGNIITIEKTCPSTDGAKEVLIQSVEAREMVGLDPNEQNGYFAYTIKAVDYVPVDDHRDFLRALGGSSSGGGGSSAGGGVPQERYERYVFGIEVPVVGTLVTQKNTVERESGVRLIRWRITANDAPTGSSFIVDIMRNGTSIFPSGDTNKIVLPATLLKNKGVTFVTDPIELDYEDELVPDILQVGSTSAGYQIQVQITAVVR